MVIFDPMSRIRERVNLKPYNTFGVDALCDYFTEIHSVADFKALLSEPLYRENKKLIIGGGSNLLFTTDFHGLVIRNCLKGIEQVAETADATLMRAAAGENWHGFVMHCVAAGLGGLENLSLIPGCVGASPMQNIGAYGAEVKDVFHELEAYDLDTGEMRVFSAAECGFGYRESVFKRQYKDRYLIASVTFRLRKTQEVNTAYGAINAELSAMNVTRPDIRDVSNAVIRIRQSKLPDPAVTGNAGSFFKNPEVSAANYIALKEKFPELVAYPLANGNYKLAAGWLIEQCGLKGYEHNGAAVHDKQALVLVNRHHCTGLAVFELSDHVLAEVRKKFGVELEREVNII